MKTLVGSFKSIVKPDPNFLKLVMYFLFFFYLLISSETYAYDAGPPNILKQPEQVSGQSPSAAPATLHERVHSAIKGFKEKCLPVPENIDESFNDETYYKALNIISQNRNNPCEASVALKLLFESSRGQWTSGRIMEELFDTGKRSASGVGLTYVVIGKLAPPVLALAVKAGDVWAKEVKNETLNAAAQGAFNLFINTKGAAREKLDSLEIEIRNNLSSREDELSNIRVESMSKLGDPPPFPYNRLAPQTAWTLYFQKEEQLKREAMYKMKPVIDKIVAEQMKLKYLNERRSLSEAPCENILKESAKNCEGQKPESQAVEGQPGKSLSSLSDKDKTGPLNDLCRCSCNPTVGGGAKYDPASGCVCLLNLGGSFTVPMASSGECLDNAAAAAGLDPKKLAEEIYKDNYEFYKKYIAEARRIIEEYLIVTPSLFQKKSEQGGSEGEKGYILLAANFSENSPMGEILYATSAAKGAPASYVEMVKEKNRRGDPDRALSLVKTAETFMPDRKSSGETANILAEFAIMMSKASLNIVTDLEFDEGLYLLRKAAGFNKSGESNALGQDINRLIGNFEKWKNDWNLLQQEIPKCLSLITKKQVCGCDKLFQDKIHPAASSLTIYESASSDKWKIGTATGTPRPIPKKDKLFDEMKSRLALAKNQCELNPALSAKEMKDLMDYDTRKKLEHSQYINQADLKKNSAPVVCDSRAVKYAEKMLSAPGLCDCQQDKIKGILDMAKKGAEPLITEFASDRKELTLGERVILSLKIKGGKPPFSAEMSGHYTYKKNYDDSRGFIINYQPVAAGNNAFNVIVADSCGESEFKKLSVYVKPGTSSKTPYDPMKDPNLQSVKKPVDTAQIDKFGADFHDTQKWNQPKADQDNHQQTAPQSEAYTGSKKKQEDGKKEKGNHQKPPYPPNNSYDDRGQKAGTDWTKWATQGAAKSTGQTGSDSVSASAGTGASSSSSSEGSGSTSQGTTQPVPKPAGSPPKLGIYLTLENKSQSPVHIFIDGFGEKMNPDNRIDPGGSRTLHSTLNAFEVVFVAGRNGQVLTSTKWIPPAGTTNADLKVVFTVNEKLEVEQTR